MAIQKDMTKVARLDLTVPKMADRTESKMVAQTVYLSAAPLERLMVEN
jgi:hypothetical protein